MLLSHHQNAGQNRDLSIANRYFENVAKLKHLGATVTKKNVIPDQIMNRLISDDVCYHKYNRNDQVKEDDMDRTCSKYIGEDDCMQNAEYSEKSQ
jgi:hypothetical protein